MVNCNSSVGPASSQKSAQKPSVAEKLEVLTKKMTVKETEIDPDSGPGALPHFCV